MDGSEREKLRILILDDHAAVRRAMRQIVLAETVDSLVFGQGQAGAEGLELALGQRWDLVIVREGLQVLTDLKRMRPDQLILVLSVHGPEGQVEVANDSDDLVSAVRRILADGTNGQSTAMEVTVRSDLRAQPIHGKLSNRELEVLRLISLGRTLKEVAGVLALSEKTVSTYRSRMLTKLGLKTTSELIRYALINGLSD
jgi:DNA-binding NarL/FixJ family response regulator